MSLVTPLIYKISEFLETKITIQRIKVNLMFPRQKINPNSYNRPHTDHGRGDAMTLIYYVNDADGDTILFDKFYNGEDPRPVTIVNRFRPKAGSAILFKSTQYHASSNPTTEQRSVINFIFWPKVIDETLPDGAPPLPDIWADGFMGQLRKI
jgi:hypothetical protein